MTVKAAEADRFLAVEGTEQPAIGGTDAVFAHEEAGEELPVPAPVDVLDLVELLIEHEERFKERKFPGSNWSDLDHGISVPA